MSAATALPQAPAVPVVGLGMPLCIPLVYTDRTGRNCLAYPRSPFNAARWLVIRLGSSGTDLECIHDDFGNLVPIRQRSPTADWTSALAWRPVQ